MCCSSCGYSPSPSRSRSNQLPLFTVLNEQYLIGRVLGSGGFGVTYKAYDIYNACVCAVKEYMPNGIAGRAQDGLNLQLNSAGLEHVYQHGEKRFMEEAAILKRLHNIPAIVDVTDYFYENSTAYFVMPFLEGCHLKQLYRDMGGIPYDFAVHVLMTVGIALLQVHEQVGLLHRDISPENIMVTPTGEIVLIDFGTARSYVSENSNNYSVLLKPGYAPPEQYSSKGNQGPWTDVYALAATFYYIVSGYSVPFSPDRLQGKPCPMLDTLCPDCSHEVAEAIDRALQLNYRNRTQSIRELLRAFEGAQPEAPQTQETVQKTEMSVEQPEIDDSVSVQPYLDILSGEQAGNRWLLLPDTDLTIGRSSEQCNIVLAKYPQVSSLHCVINYSTEDRMFSLMDLSSNGTFLNEKRLNKNYIYPVRPGQKIALAGNSCVLMLGIMPLEEQS